MKHEKYTFGYLVILVGYYSIISENISAVLMNLKKNIILILSYSIIKSLLRNQNKKESNKIICIGFLVNIMI